MIISCELGIPVEQLFYLFRIEIGGCKTALHIVVDRPPFIAVDPSLYKISTKIRIELYLLNGTFWLISNKQRCHQNHQVSVESKIFAIFMDSFYSYFVYTPYSKAASLIAWMLSGGAFSSDAPPARIYPPPFPTTSMSLRQYSFTS